MQLSFTINPSCFGLFVRPKSNAQGKQSDKQDSDDEPKVSIAIPTKQRDDQSHPNNNNQLIMKNRSITICSNTSTLPETLSTSFHNQELNQSALDQNKEDIFYKTMPTSFQQFQFKNKRRYEPQAQITQYQIKLDQIPGDQRTTLMIRNIPNKYTQPMLLENFDINHKDNYDFFYLPIDFTNKCNVGYAFINFLDSKFIPKFFLEFHGKKWKLFNSDKVKCELIQICEITYGRIQGVEQLQGHFQYSTIMQEKVFHLIYLQDKRLKPIFKKYQSDQQFKRK